MPIDPDKAKALPLSPIAVDVERGKLRFFAEAIGQSDPVYSDLDAAKQAGHPDLPVPPTYFFSLELESANPFAYLTDLGVDLRRVLHGEQSFAYHSLAYAGETLTLQPRIADVYTKKGGTLEFLVKRTDILREGGELVAEASTVVAIRHPEVTP